MSIAIAMSVPISVTAMVIAVTVITITTAIILLVATVIVPAPVTSIIVAITLLILVIRYVIMSIPVVLYKIDAFTASIVFAAMLTPMFSMTWRYTQIDRWAIPWHLLNYHRLTIDHLRRRVATNIKSTIKAGLTNTDGDANVGSEDGCGNSRGGEGCCN